MSLFEALGGSRFNVNYLRVGGVLHDFPKGWLKECEAFLDQEEKNMAELETLLTGNEIFDARTQGVGYIDPQQAIAYGLTGPMARASGINWDLRVKRPYEAYREVPVNVQVRQEVAEAVKRKDYDLAFIYAGEAVGLVTQQQPAGEVIRQLGDGAEQLLHTRYRALIEGR